MKKYIVPWAVHIIISGLGAWGVAYISTWWGGVIFFFCIIPFSLPMIAERNEIKDK